MISNDIERLLLSWYRLRGRNVRIETLHCSFPFECECCAFQKLLAEAERLDLEDEAASCENPSTAPRIDSTSIRPRTPTHGPAKKRR